MGTFDSILQVFNYLILFGVLLTASVTDIKSRVISNKVIIFGIVTGFAIKILSFNFLTVLDSIAGFIIAGGVLLFVAYMIKGGIGFGDIKLFACIGMFLGVRLTISTMLFSIFVGAVVGVILLISKRFHMDSKIPFAPLILLGVILAFAI